MYNELGSKLWDIGCTIVEIRDSGMSYRVQTDCGSGYLRNKKFLRAATENIAQRIPDSGHKEEREVATLPDQPEQLAEPAEQDPAVTQRRSPRLALKQGPPAKEVLPDSGALCSKATDRVHDNGRNGVSTGAGERGRERPRELRDDGDSNPRTISAQLRAHLGGDHRVGLPSLHRDEVPRVVRFSEKTWAQVVAGGSAGTQHLAENGIIPQAPVPRKPRHAGHPAAPGPGAGHRS